MRVALYLHDVDPTVGGGHTYGWEVFEALRRTGPSRRHEVVVATLPTTTTVGPDEVIHVPEPSALRPDPVQRVRRKISRTVRRSTPLPTAADILRDHDIDLIWSVSHRTPTLDLPYVTTVWDLQHRLQPVFPEVSTGGQWEGREGHFQRTLGGASLVIVGTEAGRLEVERFYGVPPSRIRRLPHPTPSFAQTDSGPPSTGVLERYRLEPGYVYYPAQFWAHKNHVALLRALRLLETERGARLHAVFVGSDPGNEAHVRRRAHELGVAERVHHLGFVPRADLVELYRHALALAYVSYFGPENLPPLEAFALGCPVVAADVDGAREQLGDAVLLVPPPDERAIADALWSLHEDPSLRRGLVERGKLRAASFTGDHYIAGMMDILDELEPMVRTWR